MKLNIHHSHTYFSVAAIAAMVMTFTATAYALPTCSGLERRWYDHYINDVGVTWNTSTFVCNDSVKGKILGNEALVALSLYDLETTKIPKKSGVKANLYGIIKRDIMALQYSDSCDSGVIARTRGSTVTICQDFARDSREDRASTLIHEARHTEYDDPAHVDCAGGKYSDLSSACDEVFHDGTWQGSGYNADIYFYTLNLRKGARNELSRAVMQSEVNAMIPDRFNQISSKSVKLWRKK